MFKKVMVYYSKHCLQLNEGETWTKEEIRRFYEFLFNKIKEHHDIINICPSIFPNLYEELNFEQFLEIIDGNLKGVLEPYESVFYDFQEIKTIFKEASLLFPGKIITIDASDDDEDYRVRHYFKDGKWERVKPYMYYPPSSINDSFKEDDEDGDHEEFYKKLND